MWLHGARPTRILKLHVLKMLWLSRITPWSRMGLYRNLCRDPHVAQAPCGDASTLHKILPCRAATRLFFHNLAPLCTFLSIVQPPYSARWLQNIYTYYIYLICAICSSIYFRWLYIWPLRLCKTVCPKLPVLVTECGFIYVNIPPILSVKAILPYCWANVWGTYRGHAQSADPSAARASQDRFVVALFATPTCNTTCKERAPGIPYYSYTWGVISRTYRVKIYVLS